MPSSNFNPRSHKGSDLRLSEVKALTEPFQSTLPQGERHEMAERGEINRKISIHAPTRGATNNKLTYRRDGEFQSTLPQGERLIQAFSNFSTYYHFNPRSHKGSDTRLEGKCGLLRNFNPRSHKGSDRTKDSRFLILS